MKQYYQDLITDQSWQLLKQLRQKINFVLIGGWAVFLYSQGLKSKDIDIIIDYSDLERLNSFGEIHKNHRLKKYELKKNNIDIDIYLPFFSELGIPINQIIKSSIVINNFKVPKKEILVITKLAAYENRLSSIKGQKDKIDIISLIQEDFDFDTFKKTCRKFKLVCFQNLLTGLIKTTFEMKELNLNRHGFSRLKKYLLANLE